MSEAPDGHRNYSLLTDLGTAPAIVNNLCCWTTFV